MPHILGPIENEPFRLTFNTDGKPHTVQNVLAIGTLICGIVAITTGFIVAAHVVASWMGAIGFAGGLYAQYISSTTPQRSVIIIGVVGSFVGVALGIAHGGFTP